MTLFCIDIDGTLADIRWRLEEAGPEPKERGPEYTAWLKKVQNHYSLGKDKPIPGMINMIRGLYQNDVIYVTGRSEEYREVTQKWLHNYGLYGTLLMRPNKSNISNGKLKQRIIRKYLKEAPVARHHSIVVVDDDCHGDIEEACRKNNWTFLKAKSGSFWG